MRHPPNDGIWWFHNSVSIRERSPMHRFCREVQTSCRATYWTVWYDVACLSKECKVRLWRFPFEADAARVRRQTTRSCFKLKSLRARLAPYESSNLALGLPKEKHPSKFRKRIRLQELPEQLHSDGKSPAWLQPSVCETYRPKSFRYVSCQRIFSCVC